MLAVVNRLPRHTTLLKQPVAEDNTHAEGLHTSQWTLAQWEILC